MKLRLAMFLFCCAGMLGWVAEKRPAMTVANYTARRARPGSGFGRQQKAGLDADASVALDAAADRRPGPEPGHPGPGETPDDDDYYTAVAAFSGGKWAYSPTVWAERSFRSDELWACWIFAPDWQKTPWRILDRGPGRNHLAFPAGFKRWPFVNLKGGGRALEFRGDLVLQPSAETAPYGPLTAEMVFAADRPGSVRQYLCYQRGAQASLYLDEKGYLVGQRLPSDRRHPHPFVEVKSLEPLVRGRFYHAVFVYTGREIRLYLNGVLQGRAGCRGTRSAENFTIGGLRFDPPATAVDEAKDAGRFFGRLVRMSMAGRAWNDREIDAACRRLTVLPFWTGLR